MISITLLILSFSQSALAGDWSQVRVCSGQARVEALAKAEDEGYPSDNRPTTRDEAVASVLVRFNRSIKAVYPTWALNPNSAPTSVELSDDPDLVVSLTPISSSCESKKIGNYFANTHRLIVNRSTFELLPPLHQLAWLFGVVAESSIGERSTGEENFVHILWNALFLSDQWGDATYFYALAHGNDRTLSSLMSDHHLTATLFDPRMKLQIPVGTKVDDYYALNFQGRISQVRDGSPKETLSSVSFNGPGVSSVGFLPAAHEFELNGKILRIDGASLDTIYFHSGVAESPFFRISTSSDSNSGPTAAVNWGDRSWSVCADEDIHLEESGPLQECYSTPQTYRWVDRDWSVKKIEWGTDCARRDYSCVVRFFAILSPNSELGGTRFPTGGPVEVCHGQTYYQVNAFENGPQVAIEFKDETGHTANGILDELVVDGAGASTLQALEVRFDHSIEIEIGNYIQSIPAGSVFRAAQVENSRVHFDRWNSLQSIRFSGQFTFRYDDGKSPRLKELHLGEGDRLQWRFRDSNDRSFDSFGITTSNPQDLLLRRFSSQDGINRIKRPHLVHALPCSDAKDGQMYFELDLDRQRHFTLYPWHGNNNAGVCIKDPVTGKTHPLRPSKH